ncbi:MAG: hypothetical protein IPN29_19690 [Saprospiraceae bacterium]|nr:hypothetical protein [Saprospiraceae bacterium]
MKGINLLCCLFLMTQLFAQNPEVEILKSESGNEVTYYAKSNVRDFLTVEVSIEGTGFTTSVPLPVKADLVSYEKRSW